MVVPPDYHDDQRLLTHKLRVSGCDVDTERSYDTFGNVVLDLSLEHVERDVEFTTWIVVEREAAVDGKRHAGRVSFDQRFVEPSRLTRPDDALQRGGGRAARRPARRARAGRADQPPRPRAPRVPLGRDRGRDDRRRGVGRRRRRLPGLRALHAGALPALRPAGPLRVRSRARRGRHARLGRGARPAPAGRGGAAGRPVRPDPRPPRGPAVRHRRGRPRLLRRAADLRHLRRAVRRAC